jgi:four helix bundle protein
MSLPHHRLVAWQRADDLFIDIHRLTHQRFPRSEQYELGSQLRRAAFSVAANIVEGTARRTLPDGLRFFNIASASLAELGYGLHAAHRLGDIDADVMRVFDRRVREVGAPLHGLIRSYRVHRAAAGASALALSVAIGAAVF